MSYSRLNKPSLVLPPDQRKRWRDNWGDKDLYWNQPSVPVFLEYHDVDPSFIAGMLEELSEEYSCNFGNEIPTSMKYPRQISYGLTEKHLDPAVKKLRLTCSKDLKRVEHFLGRFDRVGLVTNQGNNNMLRAIKIQLHVPPNFSDDMLRHQLASFFIETVEFLYPKMQNYLRKKKISFKAYVMGIYNGIIWGDEFMLGALGKMFNMRISVVSPFYSDIWNVFHDGTAPPDVVLVSNGIDFDSPKYRITHFSATKGSASSWKCVGADIKLADVGLYAGFTEGRKTAIDLFTISENRSLLMNTHEAVCGINELCHDLKNLCIKRDEVLEKLEKVGVKVENFKRLSSYYTDEEPDQQFDSEVMPVGKRRTQIVQGLSRSIPRVQLIDARGTEFGQKLVQEAIQDIDASVNTGSSIGDISSSVDLIQNTAKNVVLSPARHHSRATVTREQSMRQNVENIREVSSLKKNKRVHEGAANIDETVRKRCRIKVPTIGKKNTTSLLPASNHDEQPSLPSLGMYTQYIQDNDKHSKPILKRVFKSSVPVEECSVESQGKVQPTSSNEFEEGEIITDQSKESNTYDNEDDLEILGSQDLEFLERHIATNDEDILEPTIQEIMRNIPEENVDNSVVITDNKVSVKKEFEDGSSTGQIAEDDDIMITKVEEPEVKVKEEKLSQEEIEIDRSKVKVITVQPVAYEEDLFPVTHKVLTIPKRSKFDKNYLKELYTIHSQKHRNTRPLVIVPQSCEESTSKVYAGNIPKVHENITVQKPLDIVITRRPKKHTYSKIVDSRRKCEKQKTVGSEQKKSIFDVHYEGMHDTEDDADEVNNQDDDQNITPQFIEGHQAEQLHIVRPHAMVHRKLYQQVDQSTSKVHSGDLPKVHEKVPVKKPLNIVSSGRPIEHSYSKVVHTGRQHEKQQTARVTEKIISEEHKSIFHGHYEGTQATDDDADKGDEVDDEDDNQNVASAFTQGHQPQELRIVRPHAMVQSKLQMTKSAASMIYKERVRMPEKETIQIYQQVDNSLLGQPVPPEQQIDTRFYCNKCPKSFKDKNYFRRHMRRLCPGITNPELLKCKYCDKLFRHENRYKDHLSKHDGVTRHKCRQCGMKFMLETQLQRHRKLQCVQRKR